MTGIYPIFQAVLCCGVDAGKLPLEKHLECRNSRVTFNPERMRIR
ncbi:MAG: hypothetical protein ACJAVM_002532 [Sulfitobacter sp.]|jgi:hypothetical protein